MWGKEYNYGCMIISKASGRSYKLKSVFVCKAKTFTGGKLVLNAYINQKQKMKNQNRNSSY